MSRPRLLRRRVYAAAFLLVAGAAGWWLWSQRVTRAAVPAPAGPEPFVRVGSPVGREDQVVRERADIFDPAPLFVPTVRNFAQQGLPAALAKQPGRVFGDFGAKLSFDEGGLAPFAAESPLAVESLPEILARNNEAPFSGLGEVARQGRASPARGAAVSIKLMGSSEIRQLEVGPAALPRADFPPLEFLVAVGPAGLIGEPVIALSSGFEEVDGFFMEFLVRTARLGSVLGPGRYRVVVGP